MDLWLLDSEAGREEHSHTEGTAPRPSAPAWVCHLKCGQEGQDREAFARGRCTQGSQKCTLTAACQLG